MSRMREEIASRIVAFAADDRSFSGEVVFDAAFPGFDGHFPGQPILPGICMIQTVAVLASRALADRITVREVHQAKFASVVRPCDRLSVACVYTQRDAVTYAVKATLSSAGTVVSKIDIIADLSDKEVVHAAA